MKYRCFIYFRKLCWHLFLHWYYSELKYSFYILRACVVIWWLKPIKTFDTEYCALHSYCRAWDTEKRARGYIAQHHLYIMAQEGILWKYPLPLIHSNTLQYSFCTKSTSHSANMWTQCTHWSFSLCNGVLKKDKTNFGTNMKSFS